MARRDESWLAAYRNLFSLNWITLFGASLTTISALAIVIIVGLSVLNVFDAVYAGIVTFMVLPGFFVAGLIAVPVGAWVAKHQRDRAEHGEPVPVFVIDLRQARTRRTLGVVAFLSVANIAIISTVSYKGVKFSESVEFCGQVCHEVMEPEYTAYLHSPHSKVTCAECHIGPGAPWFVRSKLSGVRQVFAVLFDTHQRPIPTPVHGLRPSRETCEECHWPEKFTGDRVVVKHKFAEDEENTQFSTVLAMHIGGGNAAHDGIHSWHIDPDKVTRYLPVTEDLQEISLVRVEEAGGTVTNYVADDFEGDPAAVPDSELRVMDCIDCHNRPTHIYHLPGEAMDIAMSRGQIDRELPYIKMVGVQALEAAEEQDDPDAFIASHIRAFYEENHADALAERADALAAAIEEITAIFRRNVFPAMKVTWGTYPNHLGHTTWDGCFRCHDDAHTSPEGATISQDCSLCHQVLAWDEENPDILSQLGLK